MKNKNIIQIVGLIGIVLILSALLFRAYSVKEVATPIESVGGSILASAIVAWILLRKKAKGLSEIIFNTKNEIYRSDQTIEIYFNYDNDTDLIYIEKTHKYSLVNPFSHPIDHEYVMHTNNNLRRHPLKSREGSSGFLRVKEPIDGNILEKKDLNSYVTEVNNKVYFKKTYELIPGLNKPITYNSFNFCNKRDSMIWTVQNWSDSLNLKIINDSNWSDVHLKINHPQENEIAKRIEQIKLDKRSILEVSFGSIIQPFQGFELYWDFETAK